MTVSHPHAPVGDVHPFDARGIGRRLRHAALFGALDALQPGETLRFVNDHEDLPLVEQVRARYGARVHVESRSREAGAVTTDFSVR